MKRVDATRRKFPSKSAFFRHFAWHMPCSTRLRTARIGEAGSGNALRRAAGKPLLFGLGGTGALAYIGTLL